MDITQEQIIEAITGKPELIAGILPTIQTSESFTTLLGNRADVLYKEKIADEVKNIHSQYDNDIFNILGEKPGTNADGSKEKTYEKVKSLLTDYKTLREKKDSLSKEKEVQALQAQIDKLKTEGGAKHVQEVFDQAKAVWDADKTDLENRLSTVQSEKVNFQKKTAISEAFSGLKLNPDISETVRNMIIKNEQDRLMQSSKFEDGKLVFLDAEGKPMIDSSTHGIMTAKQVVSGSEVLKEISLKSDNQKGGGAQREIKGSIITTTVEGKDTKTLNIPKGSFKSKEEFVNVAEKALIDSGITRSDKNWDSLKNAAYKEHEVSKLPYTA